MGLLRYAVESVRHNGRRTFSSILGVLLAVTFVSGTLIAIDSSTRATLDALLTDIPGDLSFWRNSNSTFNATAFRDNLRSLAGVEDVCVYREQMMWEVSNGSPPSGPYYGMSYADVIGVDPAHVPSPLRNAAVSGTRDPPNGSAAISDQLASSLGLHLGSTVTLRNRFNETFNYTANLTVVGILGSIAYSGNYPSTSYIPLPFSNPYWVIIRLQDMPWVLRQLNFTSSPYNLAGQIWIDRLYYVNPYDTTGSKANIARLEFRIQSMLYGYGYVTDNLSPQLDSFQSTMTFQRLEFLVLSTPVLLLGVYLGAIGVDLSHAERRRELAILKTRGASRSQIVRLLLTESIFGGMLAAIFGLAAGIVLSRFLLGVVNPFAGTSVSPGEFLITRDTLLAVVFLSIALMAAVTFRSARRTASLPVVETLRYYAPGETRTQYSPRLDITLLAVGILGYALVIYQSFSSGNVFTFLIGGLMAAALPFVPILIIVGATRLATRSTTRVYELTSRACEPLAKNLHHIIRQNLARNPRRSSNIAIIIALGLGFGVFTLSFFASSQLNQTMQIRASLGADMVVQRYSFGPFPTQDPGFRYNLSAVQGVAEVAHVSSLSYVQSFLPSGGSSYYGPYTPTQFFALDPQPFFNVTQPESWYFADGGATGALAALEAPGRVVVTKALADNSGLVPGAVIPLSATFWNGATQTSDTAYLNVTVGGIVRALPGVPGAAMGGFGFTADVYAVYGSPKTFQKFEDLAQVSQQFGGNEAYFVRLQPGADWRAVKENVLALGANNVQVYQEQIDQIQNNPGARATSGFMAMEVAFIVVILTAGLCLILYAATLERDAEFAAIIARGAGGWQTAGLLVGEGFSILLVGLIVGAGMGVLTAYVETDLLYSGLGSTMQPLVPLLFVLPPQALLLLVLAPVAMFVGALVVSVRIARMNVAKVLKMRGG